MCVNNCVWFLDFGWPCAIRTDGGPQFCKLFVEFCNENCVTHELLSAYNPESNGLAEVGVHRAKKLLEKCQMIGEDFEVVLHDYLGTPSARSEFAAVFLFFGRIPRGLLPYVC